MSEKYVPTTTHSTWGSGRPRLILSSADERRELPLEIDLVRIGSSEESDIRLGGLKPLHAEIHHDDFDEYVLVLHGDGLTSAHHAPIPSLGGKTGEVLRTGARFVLGEWTFVFARDEYADHGLPYGGRAGGEGSHEPRQPSRPDYTGSHPVIRTDADGRAVDPRLTTT